MRALNQISPVLRWPLYVAKLWTFLVSSLPTNAVIIAPFRLKSYPNPAKYRGKAIRYALSGGFSSSRFEDGEKIKAIR